MFVGQEEGENFWCNSNKSNYKLLCGEKEECLISVATISRNPISLQIIL